MNKTVIILIKIIVIIAIIFYLFSTNKLTHGQLAQVSKIKNMIFFIISGLIFYATQLLSAVRLKLLLKTVNIMVNIKKSFALTMVGNLFNLIAPGATGGDFAKGLYLLKAEEGLKGKSSGVIIMDRVIGLLSLMFLSVFFAVYLLSSPRLSSGVNRQALTVVVAVVTTALLIILSIFSLGAKPAIRIRLKRFTSFLFGDNYFYQFAEGLGRTMQYRKMLLVAFFISCVIHVLSLAGILVFGAMVTEILPSIITQAAISSLVLLAGIIPVTPGNIGWTELIASFGWSAVGSSAGGAIFFYRRIATVLCSIIGGFFYILFSHENLQT